MDLIIITLIIIFIVDISGVIDNIKHLIWKCLHPKIAYKEFSIKPFDCSLCLTFWIGIVYSLIIGTFSLYTLLFICLLAMLTPELHQILKTLIMSIDKAIIWVQSKLL